MRKQRRVSFFKLELVGSHESPHKDVGICREPNIEFLKGKVFFRPTTQFLMTLWMPDLCAVFTFIALLQYLVEALKCIKKHKMQTHRVQHEFCSI